MVNEINKDQDSAQVLMPCDPMTFLRPTYQKFNTNYDQPDKPKRAANKTGHFPNRETRHYGSK
jgi:hypothetical protein